MSMIYSEAEAALLEAHRLAEGLARRYVHALEDLLPKDERSSGLEHRCKELEEQAEKLEAMIRERDLLPRESDTELADLKELGDSFVSWIDEAAAETLYRSFAEEEAALATELEQAREQGVDGLDDAIAAAREAAAER